MGSLVEPVYRPVYICHTATSVGSLVAPVYRPVYICHTATSVGSLVAPVYRHDVHAVALTQMVCG